MKKEVVQKVFNAIGDKSMVIAMEELAELQQAVSKGIRGKLDKDNLSEEIADVLIILDWIVDYFDVSYDDIEGWIIHKEKRINDRLEKGEFK